MPASTTRPPSVNTPLVQGSAHDDAGHDDAGHTNNHRHRQQPTGAGGPTAQEQRELARAIEVAILVALDMARQPEGKRLILNHARRLFGRVARRGLWFTLVVFALAGAAVLFGYSRSTFDTCCVPSSCSDVAGLDGQFPAFSTSTTQCLLTTAQATAMNCGSPANVSATMRAGSCTAMTAPCEDSLAQLVMASGICIGISLLGSIVGLLTPVLAKRFGVQYALAMLSAALLAVPVTPGNIAVFLLHAQNDRVYDNGIAQDSNDDPIHYTSVDCYAQSQARRISLSAVPAEVVVALWAALGAYAIVIVGGIAGLFLIPLFFRRRAERQFVEFVVNDFLTRGQGDVTQIQV